ncbi:MAG: TIGR03984 family CRISPR-associated protein [Alkalinema sp. RU_4_3]|nr:TIGR03984 family CRISPR-associated protein [Alkalinema sp. RU_4_3]
MTTTKLKPEMLYARSQKDVKLGDAIAACQECFSDAVGLFYSPESCFLGKVAGTNVTDSSGASVNLDRVFEARIFNADYELRWLNDRGGQGIVVLLSEKDIRQYLEIEIDSIQAIDTEDQTYLLWGEGFSPSQSLQAGWSRLATSRLGKLDVPIEGITQSKQRIKLTAKEYFQSMDDLYGNVIVAEERLTGLQKILG